MNFKQKKETLKYIVNENQKPFVNLHCHSHYSLLDGLSSPKQIVDAAVSLGHGAVAITDHASISALPELFKYCKERQIKPIIGVEFYVVDNLEKGKQQRSHLTVLAKSWSGVQSLFRQLSLANRQIHYKPRLTFDQAMDFQDCIVMSACAVGFLLRDDYEEIHARFKHIYGNDYYLEVMPHDFENQRIVNQRAFELSGKDGTMIVATNDSHYISLEDRVTHEILLAIQTRAKWNSENRFGRDWPNCDFKSRFGMLEAFGKLGFKEKYVEKWLDNTLTIANKILIHMPTFELHLASPLDYE